MRILQSLFGKSLRVVKSVLRRTGLLPYVKRLMQWSRSTDSPTPGRNALGYLIRVAQEQATYSDVTDVHELPEIFHYWSNRYLLPHCRAFGFSHPDEFFANHLEASMASTGHSRFISIGCGNCDTEVRVAKILNSRGHSRFVIECLDINPDMLARGAARAREESVDIHVRPVPGDFNRWKPEHAYEAVIANQSLHHVLELERLFDGIASAIGGNGRFITSDMIGRNGHRRWPEAMEIVQEFWRELPRQYRYNRQLMRQEDTYLDWDCSISGFEGIRAQDILPLLVDRFHFHAFLPFANVVDPFIDRAFGHNFNATAPWDRDFIDRVHARDEAEMISGRIKPCHMMAVMGNCASSSIQRIGNLAPASCVRVP